MPASEISVADALALADETPVLLVGDGGKIVGIAVRHLFQNPGVNHGRLGWSVADTDTTPDDLIENADLNDEDTISQYPYGAALVAAAVWNEEEGDFDDYDEWSEKGVAALNALPAGTVVSVNGEPFAVKSDDGIWKTSDCGWTSDDKARDGIFASGVKLLAPVL